MKKKLQIFISSTYIDLKDERQAAVEAILDAGHIPAGMELFKAGNENQLKTIKRWIDESDVYMLILGGRYGSVESESGKSYTHLEYEYAIEQGKPVFATVLSSSWLYKKAAEIGETNVFEHQEQNRYKEFKNFVHTKIIRTVDDLKDIKLAIHTTLSEFKDLYKFAGWVKGSEIENATELIKENRLLLKENKELRESQSKKVSSNKVGDFEYEALKKVLEMKTVTIPAGRLGYSETIDENYLDIFIKLRDSFSTGVTNNTRAGDDVRYVYFRLAPTLMSYGLLEKVKVAGVTYERIHTTKAGLKFFALYDMEYITI